jgi:hypothetical protein
MRRWVRHYTLPQSDNKEASERPVPLAPDKGARSDGVGLKIGKTKV